MEKMLLCSALPSKHTRIIEKFSAKMFSAQLIDSVYMNAHTRILIHV